MIDGTTDINEAKKWLRTQIITCDQKKIANGQHRTLFRFRNLGKTRQCVFCNSKFSPPHPTSTICSPVCKRERKHQLARIKYQKNKDKYKVYGKKRQNKLRLQRGAFERYATILRNVGYTVIEPVELKL